jgi:hypothetical protein
MKKDKKRALPAPFDCYVGMPYLTVAKHSISVLAPIARPLLPSALRAGGLVGK